MRMLEKIAANGFIQDTWDDGEGYFFMTLLGALVGMFVAMTMDLGFGLGAAAIVPAWLFITLLPAMSLQIARYKGIHRAFDAGSGNEVLRYLRLPKESRKEFPKNTIKLLSLGDYEIKRKFNEAAGNLEALHVDTSVPEGREAMQRVAMLTGETRRTYDELG